MTSNLIRSMLPLILAALLIAATSLACIPTDCMFESTSQNPICDYTPQPPTPTPALNPVPVR